MRRTKSPGANGTTSWSEERISGLIDDLERRIASGEGTEDMALLASSLAAIRSLAAPARSPEIPSITGRKDVSKDAETVERLLERTFAVQYNPNCFRRWLVRLPGRGLVLDLKPYVGDDLTGDHLGFGDSLAAAGAVAMQVADEASEKRRRDGPGPRPRLKVVR